MNVERVNARVQLGGHDVPEDKIISRYKRTFSQPRRAHTCCFGNE
ncbi:MAG TPA: hypothetical protein VIK55_10930 [Paludibacter sp.]